MRQGAAAASYGPDVDLRSFTPERFQVVNACHLVRTKIKTVQPRLAQVIANEAGEFVGSLLNRLLKSFRSVLEKNQIDVLVGFVPFPHADDLPLTNDGRDRIVDELS